MSRIVYCPDKEDNTWHILSAKEYLEFFSNHRHFNQDFHDLIYHVHIKFGEAVDRRLHCRLCGEKAPKQIRMMAKLISSNI